jgi:site-specific recombinase XerD
MSTKAGWEKDVDGFVANLVELERSPNTIAAYREDLAGFAAWYRAEYASDPVLAELGAAELRAWKTSMVEKGRAASTINRRLACLKSFSKWGVGRGGMGPVPVPRSIAEDARPPRWLNRREQHALIRAVERTKDVRMIAAVKVLLHTGLRLDELARLRWPDVSISDRKGTVHVRHGKGRRRRTVPLNAEARGSLAELDTAAAGGAIWIGQQGPLSRQGLRKLMDRVRVLSGLEGFSAHVLRHTFCKRLAESGSRLEEIATLAGHESLDTTRRYVTPGQEELAAAVDRLAGGAD